VEEGARLAPYQQVNSKVTYEGGQQVCIDGVFQLRKVEGSRGKMPAELFGVQLCNLSLTLLGSVWSQGVLLMAAFTVVPLSCLKNPMKWKVVLKRCHQNQNNRQSQV